MAEAEDAGFDDRDCRRDGGQSPDSVVYDGGSIAGNDGVDDSLSSLGVTCSICLDVVADEGSRSRAKLQCGHEFHLDCIGSAFNMKGAMQCPNCRKVEKGQWLYANGSPPRPFPEFIMEDWIPDEDLYGLSYPDMHHRFHWCPFGEISHAAASFESLDSHTTERSSSPYRGQHGVYTEHAATSSVARSYLTYVGPVPATTPRTSDNTNDHPWNTRSGQTENFNRPAVAAVPYIGWDHRHHSPSFPLPSGHIVAAADPVPAEVDASARPRSYPHPFLFGHRFHPRTAQTIHRHHPGSSPVVRERIHNASHLLNHHQQQQPGSDPTLIPLTRRGAPPPDQSGGLFVIPPPRWLRSLGEPETDQLQAWERDWFPHFPVPSNHRTPSNMWHRHFC